MEEYVAHVTKDDTVLEKVSRSKAHSNGLLHRAGVVLIFNTKKELFLTSRSPEKKIFPNCVDCACSFHVEYDETYEEAAQRELLEETGLREKPLYLGKFVVDKDPDHLVVSVFTLFTDEPLTLDPTEATTGKYYQFTNADKLINTHPTTHWLPPAWKIAKQALKLH